MIKINPSKLGASLLFLAISLNCNSSHAQTCVTPPTCEKLGYIFSESNCNDAFLLRCPFDTNKVYCTKLKCNIGDILYTDGTCSKKNDETKTYAGIIFDPVNRVAWHVASSFSGIAASPVGGKLTWNEAKLACEEKIMGITMSNHRLGTKTEVETWVAAFPASRGPAPTVAQNIWTASENDASTAWAYKVTIGNQIDEKKIFDKSTKLGVFCVKDY